jgi:hypothetical protein
MRFAASMQLEHKGLIMKRSYLTAAGVGLLVAGMGVAVAQDKPPANVSQAQSICAKGFNSAVKDGMITDRAYNNSQTMQSVDTNKDGRVSKSEFDNACANNLFKRLQKDSG